MSNGNDGPQSLTDWIRYLHEAAKVKHGHPDYREARAAIDQALRHIFALHVAAYEQEAGDNEKPSFGQSVATILGQGPGLGTGEVFRGIGTAMQGKGFRVGAQEYRDAVDQAEATNPIAVPALELVTAAAMPAGVVGQEAAGAIKAGVPLSLGQGAKVLGKSVLAGAVPGAVAGFSGGGADPGSFPQRLSAAGKGTLLGGTLGLIGGGTTMRGARAHVEHVADIANKGTQRALGRERLADVRQRMAERSERRAGKLGSAAPEEAQATIQREMGTQTIAPSEPAIRQSVDAIDQAVQDFKAGKITQEDLDVATAQARGEPLPEGSLSPSAQSPSAPLPPDPVFPRGRLGPEGPSPAPKASYPPTLTEMQGFSSEPRPGHAIFRGKRAPTRSAEVRGGEPLLPKASQLRDVSYQDLRTALSKQNIPLELRQAIRQELGRRGIAGYP